jgi:surface protein with Ig-like domain/uncharacterized protein DUF11/VCBS repeat protein
MRGRRAAPPGSRLVLARWLLVLLALFAACEAQAQQFETQPPLTATVGQPYLYEARASNSGRGQAEIVALVLPTWLAFERRPGGAARLQGTPPAAGAFPVTLRAENAFCRILIDLCPLQSWTITVAGAPVDNRTPTIVDPGIPDQTAAVGVAFSVDVRPAFSDADGDVLAFSATGLPPNLPLNGGVIAGTPTLLDSLSSPLTVAVTANDGRGGTVTEGFLLFVAAPGGADVFVSGIAAVPAPVVRSGSVAWRFTVGNTGPSPSGSINLAIEFAGNPFTFTTNPCTLTAEADRQRLACTVGPIASGATQVVELAGSAAQPGDVYVTATVTSGGPADPNAGNNVASLALNVAEAIVTDAAQALPVGAAAVAAGDLNGDGFADAALAAAQDTAALLLDVENPVSLAAPLAQSGDLRRGLSNVRQSFGQGTAGVDVALADLDNDQDLDAIVANAPGASSAAFRNDGSGGLTQLAALGPAGRDDRALAVADVSGDGLADVVIASANGNWLYTNGNGSAFAESALPARNGAGAIDVALVDIVGSALPDLVLVYAGGPTVRHENLGASFGAAVTIDAGAAAGVATGDFNRDGRADLVLARPAPGANGLPAIPVYLNNNAGGFVGVGGLGASPAAAVLAGDMDGDGSSDVIAINRTGAHRLFIGDGNGNFRLHPQVLVSRGATRGAIGPIGRQRRADLVLARPDGIDVFFNDGRGNLGLGDTSRPVIQLNGTPDVSIQVDGVYQDAGATVTDNVDSGLTPTVTNPVDPKVVGTYTVTYSAMDSAGNAAAPVTRSVHVSANAATGGGGGATDPSTLVVLLAGLIAARATRRREPKPEVVR